MLSITGTLMPKAEKCCLVAKMPNANSIFADACAVDNIALRLNKLP
jgi:hypothetical protein